MRYWALTLAVLGLAAVGLSACSSGTTTAAVTVTVLDQRTGKPVAGAVVSAAGATGTTNVSGMLIVPNVPKNGTTLTASARYYANVGVQTPQGKPYVLTIRIEPVPITVAVNSNLNHKPISSTVAAAGVETKAPTATATVYGVGAGDVVTITSTGYDTATAKIPPAGKSVAATLSAGPGATAQFLANAEIQQDYSTQIAFVHPAELKLISVSTIRSYFVQADQDGYSLIRWSLKSATIIPTWRFPGCGGVGAATYRNVAAVEFDSVNSAPGGSSQSEHGVEHFVKAPNGLWSWFPIIPGSCE
jgi:hypothetical protein